MKKSLALFWFAICLFLFGVVLHPLALQRVLPSIGTYVSGIHDVLRPLFFRPTKL